MTTFRAAAAIEIVSRVSHNWKIQHDRSNAAQHFRAVSACAPRPCPWRDGGYRPGDGERADHSGASSGVLCTPGSRPDCKHDRWRRGTAWDATDRDALVKDGFRGETFDTVVSCMASRTGAPKDAWAVDYQAHSDALKAAKAAGVTQFILSPAICVRKPLLAFQKAKLAFEAELIASGLDYSIVRATAFFKSLSGQIARVKCGKSFLVFGDGRLTACKPISGCGSRPLSGAVRQRSGIAQSRASDWRARACDYAARTGRAVVRAAGPRAAFSQAAGCDAGRDHRSAVGAGCGPCRRYVRKRSWRASGGTMRWSPCWCGMPRQGAMMRMRRHRPGRTRCSTIMRASLRARRRSSAARTASFDRVPGFPTG